MKNSCGWFFTTLTVERDRDHAKSGKKNFPWNKKFDNMRRSLIIIWLMRKIIEKYLHTSKKICVIIEEILWSLLFLIVATTLDYKYDLYQANVIHWRILESIYWSFLLLFFTNIQLLNSLHGIRADIQFQMTTFLHLRLGHASTNLNANVAAPDNVLLLQFA